MAIVVHPLTMLNGAPEYTADQYRKAVNGLMLPSDGSAFEALPGVRYGSPSPLCTINGLTVTVKAHSGTVSPWTGSGAYTYTITEDTTVQIASSTASYKIAVTIDDPSQGHGSTPQGQVEVFTGGTPDTDIDGLVIATVSNGVISDAAPLIRPSAQLMARSLSQLNTLTAMDGQEAVTLDDNAHYVRQNGLWQKYPIYQSETSGSGSWQMLIGETTVYIAARGITVGSGSWDSVTSPLVVPEQYRPPSTFSAACITQNGGSTTSMLSVTSAGAITVANQGSSGSVNARYGALAYPWR